MRPRSCQTARGKPKAAYATREEAEAVRGADPWRNVYPCRQHGWHVGHKLFAPFVVRYKGAPRVEAKIRRALRRSRG